MDQLMAPVRRVNTATPCTRLRRASSEGQASAQAKPTTAKAVSSGVSPETTANQNSDRGVNATSAVTTRSAAASWSVKVRSAL